LEIACCVVSKSDFGEQASAVRGEEVVVEIKNPPAEVLGGG